MHNVKVMREKVQISKKILHVNFVLKNVQYAKNKLNVKVLFGNVQKLEIYATI